MTRKTTQQYLSEAEEEDVNQMDEEERQELAQYFADYYNSLSDQLLKEWEDTMGFNPQTGYNKSKET